jgi:nicotinamide mononucleotide adenylyltransferase
MIDLNTILSELNEEGENATPPAICFYPGGFKPPHEGHYESMKDLASRSYVTKVIVLIGQKERDGITASMSKRIWDLYLAASPMAKVSVEVSKNASPIKDIFSRMDNDLELIAYVAGAKEEVEDQQYFVSLQKAFGTRVMPISVNEKVVSQNKRLSGTQVREVIDKIKQSVLQIRSTPDKESTEYSKAKNEYLNNIELLKGCFPDVVIQKGDFDDILNILGIPVLSIDQLQENQQDGQLIIRVPYKLTPKIENFLNTLLIPFEYSQHAFDGQERRMLIPNLGDSPTQREQVLKYLSKHNIPINVEEDLFTIKWWQKSLTELQLDVPTVDEKDVDPEELKKGIKTEKEHTTDEKIAKKIALAHLGEDPKYYSKLNKAGLEENETDIVSDFIDFATKALELQDIPEIEFTDDEDVAKQMHSLGSYRPDTGKLLVVRGSRMTADILRTLAHELVHRKQAELKPLTQDDGATGSPIENEANAAAGVLLRQFGQYKPEIFEAVKTENKEYKIYCDMDGVLVDFDKGYKDLTGTEASFSTDPKQFWEPIQKAGAAFWIKLKWMPDGKQLWNYIDKYNPELLSAPSRDESSKIGKFVWVKRNMPGTKLILRAAEQKQQFAKPNAILIDDRADNIQRWKDAGGVGIHHTSTADTIKQLQDLGL